MTKKMTDKEIAREMTIGEILRNWRLANGMNREQLAHHLKVSVSLIEQWEGLEVLTDSGKTQGIEIPKSASYYLRSALDKALVATRTELDWLTMIRDAEDTPEWGRGESRRLVALQSQWLREATEEFQKLPEDIRPWKLDKEND